MKTIDDMLCYNKALDQNDPECLKCDGYDATCHYYIANKTMEMYDPNVIDTIKETVIESAQKIRASYKLWKERKNR